MESEIERIVGSDEFIAIQSKSAHASEKIWKLMGIAAKHPGGQDYLLLQRYIFEIFDANRSKYDIQTISIIPEHYNVTVMDVSPEVHKNVGYALGKEALSPTLENPTYPIEGIIFGVNKRFFASLIVASKSLSLNVNFLVDSSSPHTYLRKETLEAFGHKNCDDMSIIKLSIHGNPIYVNQSSRHFECVDILGQDFIYNHPPISINYLYKTFTLVSSNTL